MLSRNPQYWRLDRYNLICYRDATAPIFESLEGHAQFPGGRIFEYTQPAIKEFYEPAVDKLTYLPAVVVAELGSGYGSGKPVPARFTRIFNVHWADNGNLAFRYRHLDDTITSEEFFSSQLLLEVEPRPVTTRTHWAVKEGDLLGWVSDRRREQVALARPRLFKVDEWPVRKRHDIAIMMPFDKEFEPVYQAIKSACDGAGLTYVRVDEIYKTSKVVDDIFGSIVQSRLVICDLTGRNPNVMYEAGLAHANNIDVVMITQNDTDVPFDVSQIRYFKYMNDNEGLRMLGITLQRVISESLK